MEIPGVIPPTDGGILQAVRDAYNAKAKAGADPQHSNKISMAFGYTVEDLDSAPLESNMGLSCGNPVAVASLREGEKVLDLGSGGGLDIFLAAARVKDGGQAIGIDGSEHMIARARHNAQTRGLKPPQVAFVQAELSKPLPILSDSIDCILSNCVINLLPLSGKKEIFKEIYRVLKPGGRVHLSDIVAKKQLPENIRNNLASYVGCIAGAVQINEYEAIMIQAGLTEVRFVDTNSDLNVYHPGPQSATVDTYCCLPKNADTTKPDKPFDPNDWVASCHIYAVKPRDEVDEVAPAPSALLNWWSAYPSAKSSPKVLPRPSVASMLRDPGLKLGKDFSIIDVRSDGHEVPHVAGSSQWTAQTFYDRINEFAAKFATVPTVIFYCSSSNGRAPRCAGWYQDYLHIQGSSTSEAFVMEGGMAGWMSDQDVQDLIAA